MSPRDAALTYLTHGISVIRVAPRTKVPSVPWKPYQSRRATSEEIRQWYAEEPSSGVGIVTGQVSAIAVLDVDPRRGGHTSLASYGVPQTPIVDTGGGGWHIYLAIEVLVPKIPDVLPGVDLQAEGAFVMAPPSIHPNGARYAWRPGRALGDVPIASLPWWLRGLLSDRRRPPSPPRRARGSASVRHAMTVEIALERLHGVRRARAGWIAQCPAHDDDRPSLSVGVRPHRDPPPLLSCGVRLRAHPGRSGWCANDAQH